MTPIHVAALFILLVLASCQREAAPPPPTPPTTPSVLPSLSSDATMGPVVESRRIFSHALDTRADFLAFSKIVAGERFTKFIIDAQTHEITYFDVNIHPMHVDFVLRELYKSPATPESIARFERNYTLEKPEFLLGYLVHHRTSDAWTFGFWEGDQITTAHVTRTYEELRKTFYIARKPALSLAYRPDSSTQERVALELDGAVPVITNDTLYRQSDFHTFNTGLRVGRLRIVRDVKDTNFNPEDVLILRVSLPDISPVSGIMSEYFSTPLSHIALRARAWGIPHVGLKNATQRFGAFEGQLVRFEATPEACSLRPASPQEIEAWEATRSSHQSVRIPRGDLDTRDLMSLHSLNTDHLPSVGAKAANLGEISTISSLHVPPGFAIPVAHYHDHLARHRLDVQISTMLADPAFRAASPATRAARLEELREAIRTAPIDPELMRAVVARTDELGLSEEQGVFVRSSTNSEDLEGFNGAGLYDTIPNVPSADDAALSRAIRRVWASVWNDTAFEERSYFGIDHSQVYGAVLIQVGVNASAAGVLVTVNTFDPGDSDRFTINAKSGLGIRVVEGRTIPEQLLYDHAERSIKVISRSDDPTMLVFSVDGGVKEVPNPSPGQPVLSDAQVDRLGQAALEITTHFDGIPLDIEWLFEGEKLHIVQVRPFVSPAK